MTEAIFGLVGVLIGGVLSGAVTLWIDRTRERRDAQAAVRLVRDEVGRSADRFDLALRVDRPVNDERSTSMWHELRPLLARSLNEETWECVVGAYAWIEALSHSSPTTSELLSQVDRAILETAVPDVRRAVDALRSAQLG